MDERAPAWVRVELRGADVYVEGVRAEGASPAERYRAALRRIAETVATPQGRPVPVWVADSAVVVNRVWVGPDGSSVAFDPLPPHPDERAVSGAPRASGGGRGWSLGSRRR